MASGWERITRRNFIKSGLVTAGVIHSPWFLSACASAPARPAGLEADESGRGDPFPIARLSTLSQSAFSGDEPHRAHRLLWSSREFLQAQAGRVKEQAPEQERARVVVIGGGMSGLISAYLLRELSPVLLEQSSRLGGNSKAESWAGTSFSLGAAYIARPEKKGSAERLLRELGLLSAFRIESGGGAILDERGVRMPFWQGVTDPERASEFRRVLGQLGSIAKSGYPDIPASAESGLSWSELRRLDSMTFEQWVRAHLGDDLHPHVATYLRKYCWSSFGGDPAEISAAQALNFLLADLGDLAVFPGGNAAIAQALTEQLQRALPRGNLRAGAVVLELAEQAGGVRVTYVDEQGSLRVIQADACVVACPKFVAARLLERGGIIPPGQIEAMRKLKYRAYLVANAVLKRRVASPSYDLFRMVDESRESAPFADVVFGGWAEHDRPERSVLTFYKPFAYDGARAELLQDGAYSSQKSRMEKAVLELLPELGLRGTDLESLRISRWGHAIPLAARGLIAEGTLESAARPAAGGRVQFAQQDNWANPAFETALAAAESAAAGIRRSLASPGGA